MAFLIRHSRMSHFDRLEAMDFARHREEVQQTWASLEAGRPRRVPIIFAPTRAYYLHNPAINPHAVSEARYFEDPDEMFDLQLAAQRWRQFNLLQDVPLGLPGTWTVRVELPQCFEAVWLGCALTYHQGQPCTCCDFAGAPERIMDGGIPAAFSGVLARARAFQEHFLQRAAREEFLGRPIRVVAPDAVESIGVFTLACSLFGPQFVCTSMLDEPERLQRLLEFINEATIGRIRAWRRLSGLPTLQHGFTFADTSIGMISPKMYRRYVLRLHRRQCDALGTASARGIRLDGDAVHLLRTIRDELNVRRCEIGFPLDYGRARLKLGPHVRLTGGPRGHFLYSATHAAIREQVMQILSSGVLQGGLFVLRNADGLPPHTPLENTEIFYSAGRHYGGLMGMWN